MKTIYTFEILASEFVNGSGYTYTNDCIECTVVDESFQIDFDYSFGELSYQIFNNNPERLNRHLDDDAKEDIEYTIRLVKTTVDEDGDEEEVILAEEARWESSLAAAY